MATLDAVSYFTHGLCVPTGELDAVSYFTHGLLYPTGGEVLPPDRGDVIAEIARLKFWFDVGRNKHVGDPTLE